MANIAVTISVIFSLFLISHARIQLTLPDDDVTTMPENGQNPLPLPTEKLETDAMVMTMEPDSESDSTSPVRMFRPVNRHFRHMPGKRPFGFRFPHGCHHHHHSHVNRPHGIRFPYGDDMIQIQEFNVDMRQIPGFPGEKQRFPERLVRMNSGSLKDEVETNMPEFHRSVEKTEREERRPFFRATVFRMNGGSLKDDVGVEMPLLFETEEVMPEREEDGETAERRFPVRMNGGILKEDVRGNRGELDEEERREGGFIKRFQDFLNHL